MSGKVLYDYVKNNDLKSIQTLINTEQNIDTEYKGYEDRTPLLESVWNGNIEMV